MRLAFLFPGVLALVAAVPAVADEPGSAATLNLRLRSRVESPEGGGTYQVACKATEWDAERTAVIVCDMWQKHWCDGAVARGAEMAPRMNEFLGEARRRGALIVHAPSGGMHHYQDHPARRCAREAPKAANLPEGIAGGCGQIEREKKGAWPIDQSDGGCDCQPRCPSRSMDVHQSDLLPIHDEDAVTDSGVECWNLFEQRGISNVMLVGVHTNMCVIGRPFGLRNMVRFGKNVVLVRDLTDTMYNSRRWPYVSHCHGTDLIVEHIEKFVCATITSDQLCDGLPVHFSEDDRPHAVVVIGEDHFYRAPETMSNLAAELVREYGFRSTVLRATSRIEIPGLEALQHADLALFYIRRRMLPRRSMEHVRAYLDAGKPLVAFRTTSHAFSHKDQRATPDHVAWETFDRDVLGCRYGGYLRGETDVRILPHAADYPILRGLAGPYRVREALYRSRPLADTCTPLLMGKCVDGSGDDPRYRKASGGDVPEEPVAWTNLYKSRGRVFATSLGDYATFQQPWFHDMVVRAVFWAIDRPVPEPVSGRPNQSK